MPANVNPSGQRKGRRIALFIMLAALVALQCIIFLPRSESENKLPSVISTVLHTSQAASESDADTQPVEEVYVPVSVSCGDLVAFMDRTTHAECDAEGCVWSCESDVVSVSDAGEIQALGVGDATLTATAPNGDTYTWNLKARKVAFLTFDDFPNSNTPLILDTLAEKNAKATFFLCKIPKTSEPFAYYKRIVDEGHCIGNHTTTHNRERLFANGENLLYSFSRMEEFFGEMGYLTKFIRVPYGSTDPYQLGVRKGTCRKLREKGYTIVDWTASSNDSYCKTLDEMIWQLEHSCDDYREIVLFHHNKWTAREMGAMIDWLREQGYEFDTINHSPQLFCALYGWEDNLNMDGAGRYSSETLTGASFSC